MKAPELSSRLVREFQALWLVTMSRLHSYHRAVAAVIAAQVVKTFVTTEPKLLLVE